MQRPHKDCCTRPRVSVCVCVCFQSVCRGGDCQLICLWLTWNQTDFSFLIAHYVPSDVHQTKVQVSSLCSQQICDSSQNITFSLLFLSMTASLLPIEYLTFFVLMVLQNCFNWEKISFLVFLSPTNFDFCFCFRVCFSPLLHYLPFKLLSFISCPDTWTSSLVYLWLPFKGLKLSVLVSTQMERKFFCLVHLCMVLWCTSDLFIVPSAWRTRSAGDRHQLPTSMKRNKQRKKMDMRKCGINCEKK